MCIFLRMYVDVSQDLQAEFCLDAIRTEGNTSNNGNTV